MLDKIAFDDQIAWCPSALNSHHDPARQSPPRAFPMTDTLRRRLRPLPDASADQDAGSTELVVNESSAKSPLTTKATSMKRPVRILSTEAFDDQNKSGVASVLTDSAFFPIAAHLTIGTVFLSFAEGWSFVDSLYFSVVIATTVGYGDMIPTTNASKVFVSLYAIVSVVFIARLLQMLVERFISEQSYVVTSVGTAILGKLTSIPFKTAAPSISCAGRDNVAPNDDLLTETENTLRNAQLTFRVTVLMLLAACSSGSIMYMATTKSSLIDMIYFLSITMTTVGLGDIHPATYFEKMHATIWLVFMSLGFANVISQYANVKVKERELDTVRSILSSSAGNEHMFDEIAGDQDGTLSEAEYLGYIICKLRKVSPSEVRIFFLAVLSMTGA